MKQQFKEILHQYKVDAFKIAHNAETTNHCAEEILRFTEQALNNAYHYHFHTDPSPQHLETFTMIKNFTLEALMPPVLEKLLRRLFVLEKQHEAMVRCVDQLLEALSGDERQSFGASAG